MGWLVAFVLPALAAYFGWLAGRRWERGRIEMERDEAEVVAYQRSRRDRSVRLNTIQIRR